MSTRARIIVLIVASSIAAVIGWWQGHQREAELDRMDRCPLDICTKLCRGEPEPVSPPGCPRPVCLCTRDSGVSY